MKLKRLFILSAVLCFAFMGAKAEEVQSTASTAQDSTIYEFNPHWYIQAAFGYQYTIGEADAATLSSPNAQLGFGYNFTPVWGLRFNINAWQSRDGYLPSANLSEAAKAAYLAANGNKELLDWKWYYVAPALDVTMDLTNLIGGYKPKRICNVGIFLGIGANIFFKNDEAAAANQVLTNAFGPSADGNERLIYLWEGCKASVLGQAGATVDFRVTEHFRLGLELQGNILADKYNSKQAFNPDWYINALVTARYNFGALYNEKKVKKEKCEPEIVEKIVEKPVEKIIEKTDTVFVKDPLKVEIFFAISSDRVSTSEYLKIKQIVNYLKSHPEAKCMITGYADKATGSATVNQRISEKRAAVVKDELIKKHGIAADRIITKAMGDTEQPYDNAILNRVAICVVE